MDPFDIVFGAPGGRRPDEDAEVIGHLDSAISELRDMKIAPALGSKRVLGA